MGTVQNLHKINPIKRQIVNDIVNEIKSYEHVSQVVIFGSSIRNDCRAKSDLDIALKWDEESIMLARQAQLEQQRYGHVIVTCPKCHQHPKVTLTLRGERLTISCPCRYVLSGEIYF